MKILRYQITVIHFFSFFFVILIVSLLLLLFLLSFSHSIYFYLILTSLSASLISFSKCHEFNCLNIGLIALKAKRHSRLINIPFICSIYCVCIMYLDVVFRIQRKHSYRFVRFFSFSLESRLCMRKTILTMFNIPLQCWGLKCTFEGTQKAKDTLNMTKIKSPKSNGEKKETDLQPKMFLLAF